MKSTQFAVIQALFAGIVSAQDWDYTEHGADWDLDYPGCGDSNQSPINLITIDRTAREFEYVVYDAEDDELLKTYDNQEDITVQWTGTTTQVTLNADTTNEFSSTLASTLFGASKTYIADYFEFHSGSEHTINGERLDLELQVYHTPTGDTDDDSADSVDVDEDFLGGAIAVLFSSNEDEVTADLTTAEIDIIDTFFQSLQWENINDPDVTDPTADPVVDLVSFGNLMELVDLNNRWVYKGSGTVPPCSGFGYWNVLSTVYPIKEEHLALFKDQLDREDLSELGNYREIQDIDDHNVVYITDIGRVSQKITNLFKGASTYLNVGSAMALAYVATTL